MAQIEATPNTPEATSPKTPSALSIIDTPPNATRNLPKCPIGLPPGINIFMGNNGKPYVEMRDYGNPHALMVGGRKFNNLIRSAAQQQEGKTLRKRDLEEINDTLLAHAETINNIKNVWNRVAPIDEGIEIDQGDDNHTRVRITAGKVELITEGSETLFFRPSTMLPMAKPAETGDLNLLNKYLNMGAVEQVLLIAWISYTLAHPKAPTSKYVILVLLGGQGTGKSSLCNNVISKVIDPGQIGVQIMPKNTKDLAIATQNSHVLYYDNIRSISHVMSDNLCTTATGGAISSRKLYSDEDQSLLYLHAALVLNGLHSFLDQADLAQRGLPLRMLPLNESDRKSDVEMAAQFETDLPSIMRGLFDLIAEIFKYLPDVEVTNPERMIDFSRWLAAMEKVDDAPAGTYQREYSNVLNQGQLDALMDSPLAAVILEFADTLKDKSWAGTPAELLSILDAYTTVRSLKSSEWPLNAIALSKRIIPLQAGLLTQGINVEMSRGKYRKITIAVIDEDY